MGKRSGNKKTKRMVDWILKSSLATVLIVGLALSAVCGISITNTAMRDYKKIVENTSLNVACLLDELSPGDYRYEASENQLYKGDVPITDAAFDNMLAYNPNVHHTIFWGDTRIITDVTDNDGNKVVGTKLADLSILEAVKKDGIYIGSGVNIAGKNYTVCYYPLKNGDEVVGMVFTGVNERSIKTQMVNSLIIAVGSSLVLAVVVFFVMVRLITKKTKVFGIGLTSAKDIAEEKMQVVTTLGTDTRENMLQINQAIDQVAMAVTSQASHTEEIMGTMEEFGSNLDKIMEQVEDTNNEANSSNELIRLLQDKLLELEEASINNSREIVSISEQIEEDNKAVVDINKIIDVINDIAFQITILSFNASVEAARAGEVGRGFAVVADSIKDLSDKTKASLDDITNIVSDIIEKMQETTKASAQLISDNDNVVEALTQTKQQLTGVTESFEKMNKNLERIMEESVVINDSKNQVIQNVSSLAAASEENAAMSQEMKATSDEVIHATDQLLDEIEKLEEVTAIIHEVRNYFADEKFL